MQLELVIVICACTYIFLILFCSPLITAADWMASPMVFVFCTPDVTVSSKTSNTVLARSPETKELPLPSHTATPQCPDFQTRWLKAEAKVVNSNYVHFHRLCHERILKCQFGILFPYYFILGHCKSSFE